MKKYINFFSVILLATLSFTLMSCSDDDENNETNGNTIEINGVMRTVSTMIGLEGSWSNGSGEFTLTVDNVKMALMTLNIICSLFKVPQTLKREMMCQKCNSHYPLPKPLIGKVIHTKTEKQP